MLDNQGGSSSNGHASHSNAQEVDLRQYTAARIAQREEIARPYSPEPHLEMMRPVSPFQNTKRYPLYPQHDHQQPKVTHPPAHRPTNIISGGVRGPRPAPSSAPQAFKRSTRVQEAGPSALTNSASTVHASTRSKTGPAHSVAHDQSTAHKSKARDARHANTTDSRTTPAPSVQVMNVRSSTTPASSETGHTTIRAGGAPYQSQLHAQDSADEYGYLSLPEKGASNSNARRKKDPSYRKPAPTYVPTPPSTPPTVATGSLGRVKEDLVPPIPSVLYEQPERIVHHVKIAQDPPPRPARTASVPPNSHMSTASKSAAPSGLSKLKHMQRAAPTRSQGLSVPRKPSPPLAERTPSKQSHSTTIVAPQTHLLSPSQPHTVSVKTQAQPRAASPSPLSAPPQPTTMITRKSSPKPEAPKHLVVYPEPKRVPSLAQLVEQARPTRTPSPRVPPKDNALETKQEDTRIPTRTVTPIQTVPIISVTSAITIQEDLLRPPPDQILCPPSVNASAKSSRSPSPRPLAPSPVPDRTRSRSPVPVNIPQYAPPPPPYTSPPPNTPLAAPKPRFSMLFQAQIAATLAEKMVSEEDEAREELAHATPEPTQSLASSVPCKREPVSIVPDSQRHSGLVTPPHTPPGRAASRIGTMNAELPAVEQPIPTERSRSVIPPVSSASVVAQKIQTQNSVKKAPVVQPSSSERRASTPPARSVSPTNDAIENPPLPTNWKESIDRGKDYPEPENASASIEIQIVGELTAPTSALIRDGSRRRPVIISEIIDVEHAPKISEVEAHNKPVEVPQVSNSFHIAVPQQQLMPPEEVPRRTRSPRPIPIPPPDRAATIPQTRGNHENIAIASSHLLAPLRQADLPERTRSPVPRKKPEEQEATAQRNPSPVNHTTKQELDVFMPVTDHAENVIQIQQPVFSSSNAPKRTKAVKSKQNTIDTPKALVIPRKEDSRPLTPPPRAPSRSAAKASETSDKQATGYRALWIDQVPPSVANTSSPLPTVRPLSPSPKNHFGQSTVQHHVHKNHEVIQPFRPPTPPTTSHYRKKRSFDFLPGSESFASLMKPAVHIIYPDASSHDHSYHSGDTATLYATSTAKSVSTVHKMDDDPTPRASLRKTGQSTGRAQSPDLLKHFFESNDNPLEIPDEEPAVPSKSPTETHLSSSLERLPDFIVQHAMRGPVRYPSAPIGESRAHTLTLPPSLTSEPRRPGKNYTAVRPQGDGERARSRKLERRDGANASKTARSHSEKHTVDNNARPMARSRSTPLPHGSQNRSKKGFWQIVGAWAKQVATKLKTWATPASSPPASPVHNRYQEYQYDY